MHPLFLLMQIAAAVMLLLWAVRMVRTGVERAWGHRLRATLRKARGGPFGMALAGMVLALVLQSSTAVGVLSAGFATSGLISVSAGIAALLGADLGSALAVKILSFDLSALIPLLILIGASLFLKSEQRTTRQVGRITMGIAFILLSLRMIGEATAPLRDSAILPDLAVWFATDPLTAFALAAVLTWALHSSVATLLILASFAANGLLPIEAAIPMVLGANVGAGLIAFWLTRAEPLPGRRIPLANLIFRGCGAVTALVIYKLLAPDISALGQTPAQQLVNLHLMFNAALLLVCLPFITGVSRLTERLCPAVSAAAPFCSALDPTTIARPALALACAQRELLRMGEALEAMLKPVMDVLETGDLNEINRIKTSKAEVHRRHSDIKLFIAEMSRTSLRDEEARRALELAALAIDFEAISTIISRILLEQLRDKTAGKPRFSPEGWAELRALHARVRDNLQVAMNVLISRDLESARQLVAEKSILRQMERDTHDHHLARLRSRNDQSLQSSDRHMQLVRALKDVNSTLVKVAYPILAEQGHLRDSRLIDIEPM